VRFGDDEAEQAGALGALHQSGGGYVRLIVGQEVADQLAGDWLDRCVRAQRRHQRDQRRWERERAKANGTGAEAEASLSEEEQAERRRAEREAERDARRTAAAHNAELGAAAVKGFARVKLDGRVVKLLACLNLGSELDQIAMRGARYGFPGWPETVEQKNGRQKTVYLDRREDAGAKARDYLSVAKTPQELAGRLLALVAMARYADEGAVAQSARSFYSLPVPRALPWSDEVGDLIDELAAERLPDHLTQAKREERTRQREAQAEHRRLGESVDQRLAQAGELAAEQRAELVRDAERAWGPHSPEAWKLRQRIKEIEQADGGDPGDAETEPTDEPGGAE
jgi:hypothetical protein